MSNQPFLFGISTLGCPDLTLGEAAKLLGQYHIAKLSLRTLEKTCRIAPLLQRPAEQKILAELSQKGQIFSLDSGFNLTIANSGLDELLELAAIADCFHIPYVRIFGGGTMTDPISDDVINIARAHLAIFDAKYFQCQLLLETHDGFSSGKRCAELFAKLGRGFPVLWDMEHTIFTAGETLAETYQLIGKNLCGFHLKDCVKRDGKLLARLPGEGDFPYLEWLNFIREKQIQVPVMFEYEKMWQPEIPPLEVALQAMEQNWRSRS